MGVQPDTPTPEPGVDLSVVPTSAIAFMLGVCCGRQQRVENAGQVAGLAEELKRRDVYDEMSAAIGPTSAATLALMVMADRGQRWVQSYRRKHTKGTR